MVSNTDPAPGSRPRVGLSLYANLLDPDAASAPGTISRAPVRFQNDAQAGDQDEAAIAAQKQISAAALRFQPPKRPQPASQKAKPRPNFAKISGNPSNTATATSEFAPGKAAPAAPAVKSTLADWTGDDDDAYEYNAGAKRERGGRKKRKKQKEEKVIMQNWDDIYDPSRPNNYEDYKQSEEKYREIREWKDRLYAHRRSNRAHSDDYSDDSEHERPSMSRNFAPPSEYAFAPPESYNDEPPPPPPVAEYVPPPPPTMDIPDYANGEDAYARRMRLSQVPDANHIANASIPPPPPTMPPAATPPTFSAPVPPPPPPPTPPAAPAPTISRAAVRYNLPAASSELPTTDAEFEAALQSAADQEDAEEEQASEASDAPRSLRPGQKGFAERLMSKYGWTKGSGLGASGTGMVNPLRVQIEKRKKKSDAEGGGYVGPAGKGKIIAGKLGKPSKTTPGEAADMEGGEVGEEEGFGSLSEVVQLIGMVDGLDLDTEMADGSLMQEIGEECGEKYGRVERVYIHRQVQPGDSVPVFIKFTSPLSALRAVNALEGRIFNGNVIKARYFDADNFDQGVFT